MSNSDGLGRVGLNDLLGSNVENYARALTMCASNVALRRAEIALSIAAGRRLMPREIQKKFGVSKATACRDFFHANSAALVLQPNAQAHRTDSRAADGRSGAAPG